MAAVGEPEQPESCSGDCCTPSSITVKFALVIDWAGWPFSVTLTGIRTTGKLSKIGCQAVNEICPKTGAAGRQRSNSNMNRGDFRISSVITVS